MWITDQALRARTTVFFLMAGVTLLGLLAYLTLPRESNPDVQIPYVLVITPYPGASPVDVERQVTQRIEREIQGIDGLKTLSSISSEGASSITVEFDSGIDVDAALQKVRDRVERAVPDLPRDAEEPNVQEINFSNFPILQINLSGAVGPVVLKQLAEDLEDEIEIVPGVLEVTIVGGLEREVRVEVDPEKLRLYGLSLDDVVEAIREENVAIPGGSLELGDQSFAVRVPGEVDDPLAVADFVVRAQEGRPVFVRDIAEVRFGFKDRQSYSHLGGDESVALSIQKRVGANVIQVVSQVREVLERQRLYWPAGVEATILSDQSEEIEMMLSDLENNILSGLLLVVVVLMFFLGLRTAVFVGLAIPFSMLLTFVVIELGGITLNMVVLFALVLAVGMLVDNAVVVIENIYRYLQKGFAPIEAASKGTREVGAAVAVSTFTTVGAFAPLLFWPGIMGQFMRYLPLTVSIALLSSLLVALTVNPVVCSRFLRLRPREGEKGRRRESGHFFLDGYRRLLIWSLEHRVVVIVGTLICFLAVLVLFARFNHGVQFMTETEPSRIWVDVEAPPGTRLEKTERIVEELAERLQGLPDLEFLATASGSGAWSDARQAFFGGGGGGAESNRGRLSIELVDRSERSQNSFLTMEEIRRRVQGTPGVEIQLDRETDGPPTGDALALEIAGEDFATLGRIAAEVRRDIADIPGIVSLDDDFDVARPEVLVDVDRTRAARLGLSTAKIARTLRTAVNGLEASTFREGDEDIDITVRLAERWRRQLSDLAELTVVSDEGQQVPLSEVVTLERSTALPSITRKDRRRVVTITGKLADPRYAGPVRSEVLSRLEARPELLPPGYSASFGGQNTEEEEAKAFLLRAFLYGVLIVLALILAKFDSLAMPAIISTSVVMSMIGVLLGLLITGLPFDIIMTGLGVISLAGIVVNNAIVLLDYGEQLRDQGLERREVVVRTGLRRARPVLLTAVTTILGLIPLSTGVGFDFRELAFTTGGESSQYWRGMGVAVIFGLGFATFLTLVLVPVLYDLTLAARARRQRRRPVREGKATPDRERWFRPAAREAPVPSEASDSASEPAAREPEVVETGSGH